MRLVRFLPGDEPRYGEEAEGRIHELAGDPFGDPAAGAAHGASDDPASRMSRTGQTFPTADVRLLAPCRPRKVLAVGRNFRSHLGGRDAPREPGLFAKMPTSIIGPDEEIVLPPGAQDRRMVAYVVMEGGAKGRRTCAWWPMS